MSFIQEVEIPEQGVLERIPILITWLDISENPSNNIVVAHRTDMSNMNKDKDDLSSIIHISGNQVYIQDFFKNTEEKTVGRYAVTVVVEDVESPIKRLEMNIIGDVIRAI